MNNSDFWFNFHMSMAVVLTTVITIGSMEFLPSRVLQEMDPIAFKVGFHDFCHWMNIDLDSI